MGKTAVDGPLYGAKSLLWSASVKDAAASTGNTVFAALTTPTREDWYITEVHAFRGSTASTGFVLYVTDDSTTIATARVTSSAAASVGSTVLAPTSGEFEGLRVVAGSALTMGFNQGGSSVAASTAVAGWVYGYIRYIDSTRNLHTPS